jgi:hypothetical protein
MRRADHNGDTQIIQRNHLAEKRHQQDQRGSKTYDL